MPLSAQQKNHPQPSENACYLYCMKVSVFIRRFFIRSISLALACTISLSGWSQSKDLADLSPFFTAIIVQDIDSSIFWYQEKLRFEVEDQLSLPERGFAQANLSNGQMKLELIQLESAIDPATALPNYTSKTRMHGIFKFGFEVKGFDAWQEHLKAVQAQFYGEVVSDPTSGVRMIIILDPDGNRIQLFEQKAE